MSSIHSILLILKQKTQEVINYVGISTHNFKNKIFSLSKSTVLNGNNAVTSADDALTGLVSYSSFSPLTGFNLVNSYNHSIDFDRNYPGVIKANRVTGNVSNLLFTIECWVKFKAPANLSEEPIIANVNSNSSILHWILFKENGGTLTFLGSKTGATWNYNITTTYKPVENTWTHVAVTRDTTTSMKMYANGNLIGSIVLVPTDLIFSVPGSNVNPLYIGRFPWFGTGDITLNGNIFDVRIGFGAGANVYSGNFTPPTSRLTMAANTKLLCLQGESYIIDNVTPTNVNLVIEGEVKVVPGNPFSVNPTNDYLPSVNGSSGYFDGASSVHLNSTGGNGSTYFPTPTSYIEAPAICGQFSGSASVDFAFYLDNINVGYQFLVSKGGNVDGPSGDYQGWVIYVTPTGNLAFIATHISGTWTVNLQSTFYPAAKTWYHVCVLKSSTNHTLYVNNVAITGAPVPSSNTFVTTTGKVRIGSYINNSDNHFTGYISNLRIYKGSSNAVMPMAQSAAAAYVNLLTCINGNNLDYSQYSHTLTTSSDLVISNKSQFGNCSLNSTKTPVFNIECRFYPTVMNTNNVIYSDMDDTGAHGSYTLGFDNLGNFYVKAHHNATNITITKTVFTYKKVIVNQWNYLQVTHGTNGNNLLINLNGYLYVYTIYRHRNAANPTIGGIGNSTTGAFTGYISNFIIRNVAPSFTTYGVAPIPLPSFDTTSALVYRFFDKPDIYDNTSTNTVICRNSKLVKTHLSNDKFCIDLTAGKHLIIPNINNVNVGRDDFTIESWAYKESTQADTGTGHNAIYTNREPSGLWGITLYIEKISREIRYWQNNVEYITGASSHIFPSDSWNHIAICRCSGVLTCYLNGVPAVSVINHTGALGMRVPNTYIGTTQWNDQFNGYLYNLNIYRGVSKYNGIFDLQLIDNPTVV